MFKVSVSNKASKSILKMPKHYQERMKELFLVLENESVPYKQYDIRKMEGWNHAYRIRVGDIRIVYRFLSELNEVLILEVEWRGRVYK